MTSLNDIDTLSLSEIIRNVAEYKSNARDYQDLNIAILRNFTLEPIKPFLEYLSFQESKNPHLYFSNYDNMLQEVIDPLSPFYRFKPDIILVCVKLEIASEKLTSKFYSTAAEEIREEANRILNFTGSILAGIRKNCRSPVLIHSFEVSPLNSFGISDYQHRDKKVHTLRALNLKLLETIRRFEGVYLVDMELIQAKVGQKAFYDGRLWHLFQSPYGREALKELALEYFKFVRALGGKNKKCLVLDCDNTLWGGIIGEDGFDRIQVGKNYPGSAFKEFQEVILELYHRGILLCICSKNDPDSVLEVLDSHPGMVLRRDHFVKMKINWNDKIQNLTEIASELNIGLDSIVFIDDNEFETGLVRRLLPMVTTLTLAGDPTLYGNLLKACGLFDALTCSSEDKARNEMYKAQEKRGEAQKNFTDIGDYLRYLEMEVEIASADEFSLSRVFQLVQKTNQFNLTVKRYPESELKKLSSEENSKVAYLKLSDRFGDSGIVGVLVLLFEAGDCKIDSMLLSCRVIGRDVEKLMLYYIQEECKKRKISRMIGNYIPTGRNALVKDFYAQNGFKPLRNKIGQFEYIFNDVVPKQGFNQFFKKIRMDGVECKN